MLFNFQSKPRSGTVSSTVGSDVHSRPLSMKSSDEDDENFFNSEANDVGRFFSFLDRGQLIESYSIACDATE